MTVYGDGAQTRSFRYVSDVVDGLLRLMAAETSLDGPVNPCAEPLRLMRRPVEVFADVARSVIPSEAT